MTDSAANGQELANDFVNISSMGAGSEDSGAVGDTRGAGTRGRRARQEVRIPEKAMRYSDPNERIRVAEDQLGIRIDRLRKRVDTPLFFQVGLESEEYDWIALQLGEFLETRLKDPAEWDSGRDGRRQREGFLARVLAQDGNHPRSPVRKLRSK